MPLEQIIASAIAGNLGKKNVGKYCEIESISFSEFCNRAALTIAERFDKNIMSYSDADAAINAIYSQMVIDASELGDGFVFVEPAFSIYDAFDAGEYDRGDGADPVEKYTRPQIKEGLRAHL